MLRLLPEPTGHPRLLVGANTFDDAGVYRISDEIALVQTVDFFTPVVDDPYTFGQIAAANALSDVYAMGGRPLTCLNIAAFPVEQLPLSVLADILRGGGERVAQAGAVVVGGHTISDPEPKYGLAVTGVVHPSRVITNAGARPGDLLVLTKPLGVGIITTALKRTSVPPEQQAAAIEAMVALNDMAAAVAVQYQAHACTDVTGFGFLGHLREMAQASQVGVEVFAASVPLLPGTLAFAEQGFICGGSRANLRHATQFATHHGVSQALQVALTDAVTSGGLIISLAERLAEAALQSLHERGITAAAVVGRVTAGHPGQLVVTDRSW